MKLHDYHCKLKFPYGNKSKKTFASKRRKIAPEDFTVNKLARPDRGAVDEQDARKRAREASGQTGQRIPSKKSPDKPKSSQHYKPSNLAKAITRTCMRS